MRSPRRQRGVVLLIVLFFALLLTASIATFLKRSTVDAILSRNRDAMARAEALARGGAELAKALLIDDRVRDTSDPTSSRMDNHLDSWARVANTEIEAGDGARLRLRIEDAGSRLNLNALFRFGENARQTPRTELCLHLFLEKMIEEMPVDEQEFYETRVRELAENLIDYVDSDEVRIDGGLEDDYYQRQPSPYRAANRPLLSVDELGLVEGFDAALVDVIRPYITVYPLVGGGGVNPNTAPPHILALICYSNQGESGLKLADEEDIHRILKVRENGQIFCPDQSSPACTPISGILPNAATILPPLSYFSDTFTVRSEARVGEVRRTLEAVIDRTTPSEPLLLSWKVR
jgi:general secretion pathway protein K